MQTTEQYTQSGLQITEHGTLLMPLQEFEINWEIYTNELEFE